MNVTGGREGPRTFRKWVGKLEICELVFLGVDCALGIRTMLVVLSTRRLCRVLAPLTWCSLATVLGTLGMGEWETYRAAADRANMDRLNRAVVEYRQRTGRVPDLNLIELFRVGLTDRRLQETPYGGTYQIDPERMVVYNPHRMEP